MSLQAQPVQPLPPPFAVLYRAEFPFVFNVLRRFGVPERDLEDLAHDVFLAAYRSAAYDPSRPLRPWLMGIAFRVSADFLRRARHGREVPEEGGGAVADPGRSPHEAAEATQARDLVIRALRRLPVDPRAVFVMHELEELPMPQVARVLEIPEGTAWSRLRQARADFAQAVRELHQGGQS